MWFVNYDNKMGQTIVMIAYFRAIQNQTILIYQVKLLQQFQRHNLLIISIRYYSLQTVLSNITLFMQNLLRLKSFNSTEQLKVIAQVLCKMGRFFNEMTEQCLMELSDQQAIKHKHRMLLNRQNLRNFESNKKLQKMKLKERTDQQKTAKKMDAIANIKTHKPKHPVSSFFFYYQEKGQEIAKQTGQIQGSKKAKIVGELWKNMTDQQKEPYEAKARITRRNYEEEMIQYRMQYADEISRIKRYKKETKQRKAYEVLQAEEKEKQIQLKKEDRESCQLENANLNQESGDCESDDSLDISDALSDSIPRSSSHLDDTELSGSSSQLSGLPSSATEKQIKGRSVQFRGLKDQSQMYQQHSEGLCKVKIEQDNRFIPSNNMDAKNKLRDSKTQIERILQKDKVIDLKMLDKFVKQEEGISNSARYEGIITNTTSDFHKNKIPPQHDKQACFNTIQRQGQSNSISSQVVTKPKGPVSSFLLYYQVKGKQLAEKHNLPLGPKVIKLTSEVWKQLSADQKAVYASMAKDQRQKYSQEMVSLKQKYGSGVFQPKKIGAKSKKKSNKK